MTKILHKNEAKGHAVERKHTTVTIPKKLYDVLEQEIKNTGFSSVSSYITFVLRELLVNKSSESGPFTKEDEERVRKRLRALGYI